MVAIPRFQNLTTQLTAQLPVRLPVIGGIVAGVAAAAILALLPTATLEQLVWSSGVGALVPAAQPPLGVTARALLAMAAGLGLGAVAWSALFLLFGPGGFVDLRARNPGEPSVRRADAHPDAPPRRPMTAADLGTPLMEVTPTPPPAMRPLPADLDQPLAAFDPTAIPDVPREPVRPVAALAPGERIDTFVLVAPPPPSVAPSRREPVSAQSIDSLLRRLEEGASRRPRRAGAA